MVRAELKICCKLASLNLKLTVRAPLQLLHTELALASVPSVEPLLQLVIGNSTMKKKLLPSAGCFEGIFCLMIVVEL